MIDDCTKALSIETGYVKAFLRRSTARLKLKNYQGAVDDLTKALSLEPGNVEAKKSLLEARSLLGKSKMSTMFASSPSKTSQASQEADNSVIVAISKPLHLRSKVNIKPSPYGFGSYTPF